MHKNYYWISISAVMFILAATLLNFSSMSTVSEAASTLVEITVDGEELIFTDAWPYIDYNNRTMVPLRVISEELGAEVKWLAATKQIQINGGGDATDLEKEIILTVGSKVIVVNGNSREMDTEVVFNANQGRNYVPLRFVSENLGATIDWHKTGNRLQVAVHRQARDNILVVNSAENLKLLLDDYAKRVSVYPDRMMPGIIDRFNPPMFPEASSDGSLPVTGSPAPMPDSEQKADFSETNIQVEGVNEGDIIKTDGEFIYTITQNEMHYRYDGSQGTNYLYVSKAYPAAEMELLSSIKIDDMQPSAIYIHDEHLILIGKRYVELPFKGNFRHAATTVFKVYNIQDKRNLQELKVFEMEGELLSSRMIGDRLHVVSSSPSYDYWHPTPLPIVPMFRSGEENEYQGIDFANMYYFKEFSSADFMNIATLRMQDLEDLHIHTYLGTGQEIYVSQEHLYVASAEYNTDSQDINTNVHKFRLTNGGTEYIVSGQVKGRILNQFSMDEHNGYFRIATTTGNTWRSDEETSKNHVYILNSSLKNSGSVNDIAPTERIYAMRFMGERGYMVTFRETDPFYVIDLANPQAPQVLGYLKIPGYSDYLHPYDEHHILGFGKEVHESKDGVFLEGGMKVALFDVSDVTNPIERYKLEIGDRGTDSELLRNHRALLFDRERGLLAFPISVYEIQHKLDDLRENELWQSGQFVFQGAYVYSLDLEHGFHLQGGITHLTKEDYMKAGIWYYDSDKSVRRIIRIGDILYTVSNHELQAHGHNLLNNQGILPFGKQ